MIFRIGQGYDVHIFGPGRFVSLGGVKIEHDQGVVAHSDGDVILHALCDAIYGALAEGDIGTHFPPSDDQWRNTPSIVFVEHAKALLKERGFQISNIDMTVIAEQPKIKPHRDAIVESLSTMLEIDANQISVKATTHEKMGALGRGEGLGAMVNLLIYKP